MSDTDAKIATDEEPPFVQISVLLASDVADELINLMVKSGNTMTEEIRSAINLLSIVRQHLQDPSRRDAQVQLVHIEDSGRRKHRVVETLRYE